MKAERAASWVTIICALIAGAMRFGSIESDVRHTQEELTQARQHVSNVDGKVETLKSDKVSADEKMRESIHALTTTVAVLTTEVRELRVQLEKTEKKR